jgi:glycerate 2-kinase
MGPKIGAAVNERNRHFMKEERQRLLKEIFLAGLRAADPEALIRSHVSRRGNHLVVGDRTYALSDFRRVFLIGAGKAAALMAKALEELLEDRLTAGLIIVKYNHAIPLRQTQVIEAGHPIPDQSGLVGTAEMLRLLEGCGGEDLVIGVFSGGASALLPAPVPPLNLAQKQLTTRLLLECGADIGDINSLRKHLSRSKGGGLARAAYPATLISLILSDVVGDRLDIIASGPTGPDASRFGDCLAIVEQYNLAPRLPEAVWQYLQEGAAGVHPETPKEGDPIFAKVQNLMVGNNRMALLAAREQAETLGFKTLLLSSCLEGEAREVGQVLAAVGKEILLSGHPLGPPACVLAGGETTVTLRGPGKGGRNQELALAAAIALDGFSRISLLSAGTDGTDGPTDAAGALADGATCARARAAGLNPAQFLARQDAYNFFASLGDLLITGPTRTNVMDIMCLLIE